MKRAPLIFFVLFVLIIPFYLLTEETVDIVTGEWKPWTSEELKHGGVINHIIQEAFRREGVHAEFHYRPWKRGILEAQMGRWDAASIWAKSPGREIYFDYSDTVFAGKLNWAYRKGFTLPDMKNMNIYDDSFDITPLKNITMRIYYRMEK